LADNEKYIEEQLGQPFKSISIAYPNGIYPDGDLFESGIEELNRLAEWMNEQAEMQLEEHQ
jgi:hypothetical protein